MSFFQAGMSFRRVKRREAMGLALKAESKAPCPLGDSGLESTPGRVGGSIETIARAIWILGVIQNRGAFAGKCGIVMMSLETLVALRLRLLGRFTSSCGRVFLLHHRASQLSKAPKCLTSQ